jgi:hypothetical protein
MSETLYPLDIQMKGKSPKSLGRLTCFGDLNFGHLDLFRISDFEFRISITVISLGRHAPEFFT